MMTLDYEAVFPNRRAPCLCGFGKRFKNCCAGVLSTYLSEHTRDAPTASTNTKQSLRHARLELAAYRVRSTVHGNLEIPAELKPLIRSKDHLRVVDIQALSDLVENILQIHLAAGDRSAITRTLRELATAIDDTRWTDRLKLLDLVWSGPGFWDEKRIARGLKQIAIDTTRDPEILQVYLNVTTDNISLSRYREICQIIAEETLSQACRLQYRFLAALRLDLHGDNTEAASELKEAVEEFERASATSPSELYGHIQYGRALTCLASWSTDEAERQRLVNKAYNSYEQALKSGRFNPSGQASVLQEMGQALAAGARWKDAKELARQSAEIEDTFMASLLLIQSCMQLGEHAAARTILDSLSFAKLPPHNQVDHTLALAEIACSTEDASLYALTRERLLSLDVETPRFRERVANLAEQLSAQEREALRKELEELKMSHERTSFDPLHLSDSEIRSVMRHHRFLPPNQQSLTLPLGLELKDMLGSLLAELSKVLLDQRALLTSKMRSNEDTYTTFIAIQLQAAVAHLGWQAQSQDYGGDPREGSAELGRRDITVRKDGSAPFAIVEAVRARSQTGTSANDLDEHVHRLLRRYDAARAADLFVLIFVECAELSEFRTWYCNIFTGVHFEEISVSTPQNGDDSQSLLTLRAQHSEEATRRTVNHILLRIRPND